MTIPGFVEGVVTIAAPRPIFRFLDQVAFHGIAVDVLQLLDKLFVVANVAVVVSALPKESSRLRGPYLPSFGRCGSFRI